MTHTHTHISIRKRRFHIDFLLDSLFGFFEFLWFVYGLYSFVLQKKIEVPLRFAVLGRHMQPLRSRVASWKLPPQLSSLHLRSHGGLSVWNLDDGGAMAMILAMGMMRYVGIWYIITMTVIRNDTSFYGIGQLRHFGMCKTLACLTQCLKPCIPKYQRFPPICRFFEVSRSEINLRPMGLLHRLSSTPWERTEFADRARLSNLRRSHGVPRQISMLSSVCVVFFHIFLHQKDPRDKFI